MKSVAGRPVLFWVLKRALKSSCCDHFCVATTTSDSDDEICSFVTSEFPSVHLTRGSERDVLVRYWQAILETKADIIVRITSDDPFLDPFLIDQCVNVLRSTSADAVRTVSGDYPVGLDVEVYTRRTLQTAHEKAGDLFEREHVGPYVFQTHSSEFTIEWVHNEGKPWPQCRLTLDYAEDFLLLEKLYAAVGPEASAEEYRLFLSAHPEIAGINLRCEGTKRSDRRILL